MLCRFVMREVGCGVASAAPFGGKNLCVGKKSVRAGREYERETEPNHSKYIMTGGA